MLLPTHQGVKGPAQAMGTRASLGLQSGIRWSCPTAGMTAALLMALKRDWKCTFLARLGRLNPQDREADTSPVLGQWGSAPSRGMHVGHGRSGCLRVIG